MKYLPYIVLEVVLPGGTLFAAGLWLYRNRKNTWRRCRIGSPPFD
jgi:hypothetical protein